MLDEDYIKAREILISQIDENIKEVGNEIKMLKVDHDRQRVLNENSVLFRTFEIVKMNDFIENMPENEDDVNLENAKYHEKLRKLDTKLRELQTLMQNLR